MSIFHSGSVIIIGAGASVPFGAPDGIGLMDKIEQSLKNEIEKITELKATIPYAHDLSYSSPTYYAWHSLCRPAEVHPDTAIAEIRVLTDWLSTQTSDSIDDLIRHNPIYADKLKICVVYELLKATHLEDDFGNFRPKALYGRMIPEGSKDRNWVHRFINVARAALIEARSWEMSIQKVKIVSLNYDGILEFILDRNWNDVEQEYGLWQDVFEISHPHGFVPIATNGVGNGILPNYLSENAKKIVVVHDTDILEEVANARALAHDMCKNIRNVYAFGFSFAPMNCRLLGLDSPLHFDPDSPEECECPSERTVHYVNYDGSDGLQRRVESMTKFDQHYSGPATEAPMRFSPMLPTIGKSKIEITDALLSGFLGEMPA